MSSEPGTPSGGDLPAADPWSGSNPLDPAYRANPHPFLKRLRETDPVRAAAHRDPAAFPDPDRCDIARTGTPNLAFGGGIHHCLGAHLARMETQAAIGTLVARCDDLELASADLEWGRSLFRVLGRLPVRFRARDGARDPS